MGADTIVNGPPAAAQPGTEGLILDQTNGNLYVFGASGVPSLLRSAIAVLGAQTALTAITTAQNLLTKVFAAGSLNIVGRTLVINLTLTYNTTSTNVATLTFAVTLGGVTLFSVTTDATNTAASSNLPVQIQITISTTTTGAAATMTTSATVNADLGTAAAAAVTSYVKAAAVSSAVNLLTAETLAVTIAASAAIPSATVRNATIELVA